MKKILVVDDEFALVETLTDLLSDAGYQVVSASNGKDGLMRAIAEWPDLILSDLMMPISDGKEMIHLLRGIPAFRAVPVVMMSTSQSAQLNGAKDRLHFIDKPFHVDELLGLVRRILGE